MDMQAGGGFDPPAKTDSQELTFHWLYQRVQGLVEHSIYPKAGRVETWAFRIGVGAAIIGILMGQLPDRWLPLGVVLQVVVACLAIESEGSLSVASWPPAGAFASSASRGSRTPGRWMKTSLTGKRW
ncbi:hypothetical protein [Stenotrophomonas hibiscicola]|uniref:hypothetical protein n=1 Tax=Stenotrophomonas hibiscicola TaxID=86189 RepID=UPI002155A272|nr:hypothetical protein [[Pseudomonas] hibiscicola]